MRRRPPSSIRSGPLTWKAFFQAAARALQNSRAGGGEWGCFIMVDVDCFKEVNDRHGHPEGDRILRETARVLRQTFGREALCGRVGGDEFAVLLAVPLSRERLEAMLALFLEQVHTLGAGEQRISCSAGAVPLRPGQTAEALYQAADRMLYRAKQQGRGRYVLDAAREPAASEGEPV